MRTAPAWLPAALRQTDAARYVGMTSAQFDRAVACGEMPDPIHTSAGERWRCSDIDLALDRLAGNVANDWRAKVRTR